MALRLPEGNGSDESGLRRAERLSSIHSSATNVERAEWSGEVKVEVEGENEVEVGGKWKRGKVNPRNKNKEHDCLLRVLSTSRPWLRPAHIHGSSILHLCGREMTHCPFDIESNETPCTSVPEQPPLHSRNTRHSNRHSRIPRGCSDDVNGSAPGSLVLSVAVRRRSCDGTFS